MLISLTLTLRRQRPNLGYVAENVADLLQNTSSDTQHHTNIDFLAKLFQNPINVDCLLSASSLYEQARKDGEVLSATKAEHQLSAKLHCLYGIPLEYSKRTGCTAVYPYAASKVYDLRQYTDKTFWGPFLDDGSQNVDWEKVEAIMVVLGHNLQLFSDRTNGVFEPIWTDPFVGANPNSYHQPTVPPLKDPSSFLTFEDPYNITGTWMRVVCFLGEVLSMPSASDTVTYEQITPNCSRITFLRPNLCLMSLVNPSIPAKRYGLSR